MIAVSFYNSNIDPLVVDAQAAVFKAFGLEIRQYLVDTPHGISIDNYLRSEKWESVCIFDIDCIPLRRNVLVDAKRIVEDGQTLYGIAQAANHLNSEIYVGPPFIAFSHKLYEDLGYSSFRETPREDVGGQFTRLAQAQGKEIRLLWPTHVENPLWKLDHNTYFGHGTTYQDTVYHAFESRFNHESTSRFITKCNQITDEN